MTRPRLLGSVAVMLALTLGTAACAVEEEGSGGSGEKGAKAHSGKRKAKRGAEDKPAAEKRAEREMTSGQENALESAQSYVDMTGFSKAGLIDQLSSPAGEGYSKADAIYAANHVDVDWNEEAVESAQSYLDMTSFSRQGLIEQLTSSAGEQFTQAQAEYAVNKVY